MAKKNNKIDFFKNLSLDDLRRWAGSTIVSGGKDYQKSGYVEDLSLTSDGALIAWVLGTHRYATLVEVQKGKLISDCNCPDNDTCKHAVAVVLEGLDYLKKKKEIPLCSKKDRRFESLESFEMEEEWEEEWEEDDEEEEELSLLKKTSSASKSKSSGSLQTFLKDQTKPQLINLIQELADAIPELNQALEDRQALSRRRAKKNGPVHQIRNQTRN